MVKLCAAMAVLLGGLVSSAVRAGIRRYGEAQRVRDAALSATADQNALGFRDASGRLH